MTCCPYFTMDKHEGHTTALSVTSPSFTIRTQWSSFTMRVHHYIVSDWSTNHCESKMVRLQYYPWLVHPSDESTMAVPLYCLWLIHSSGWEHNATALSVTGPSFTMRAQWLCHCTVRVWSILHDESTMAMPLHCPCLVQSFTMRAQWLWYYTVRGWSILHDESTMATPLHCQWPVVHLSSLRHHTCLTVSCNRQHKFSQLPVLLHNQCKSISPNNMGLKWWVTSSNDLCWHFPSHWAHLHTDLLNFVNTFARRETLVRDRD